MVDAAAVLLNRVFILVVRMSISAVLVAVAVLLLRLMLSKASKRLTFFLWVPVILRLLIPVFPGSGFSLASGNILLPSSKNLIDGWYSEEAFIVYENDETVPQAANENTATPAQNEGTPVNDVQRNNLSVLSTWFREYLPYLTAVWITGCLVFGAYVLLSSIKLGKAVRGAALLYENVYSCETINEVCVLGILRPRIYIPANVPDKRIPYIVEHEKKHIRYLDHVTKPAFFLLLGLHWFNPVIWLVWGLMSRDMEIACDEDVICKKEKTFRKEYCEALIYCSMPQKKAAAPFPSFGDVAVEKRVKKIIEYRKPKRWINVLALLLCLVAGGCNLTDPKEKTNDPSAENGSTSSEEVGTKEWQPDSAMITFNPLSADQFEVTCERIDDQNILFVLQNNSDEAVTAFRIGPYFEFAWQCQAKNGDGWKIVPSDGGTAVSMILNDLTRVVHPGEKESFLVNLARWTQNMQRNQTYRVLVTVYAGEISRDQAASGKADVKGVMCLEFEY